MLKINYLYSFFEVHVTVVATLRSIFFKYIIASDLGATVVEKESPSPTLNLLGTLVLFDAFLEMVPVQINIPFPLFLK